MGTGVAITGMGIISSIGDTVEENYNALVQGKTGIADIEYIATVHRHAIKVGEIKKTNKQLEEILGLAPDNNFTRTGMLGVYAAKQAVANAGITDINAHSTGLISSTSVGGMDMTERYFYEYAENQESRRYIGSHDAGDSTHKIAEQLGLKGGLVTTISTACSSAANSIMMGARLIKAGKLDRVIVGGADALSKFTINGFKTLMILSDTYNTPFDNNRKGLNLGEAAAFLVLESDAMVKKYNKTVLAYLSGYGNANDAYHQTASSENGDGAFLATEKALKVAGVNPSEVSYINAHGTATPNNDLSEGRALLRVFGQNTPDFSSTKPFTGHTLAAAAAIEAVYSILALQHNVIFPNLNFTTPMEEFNLIPQTVLKQKQINHVLSNSFGFGGNCSALLFSKS
ncbi:beta-ketoacyl-[acyl-carrier-protein] synthase family protein [Flavobacterium rhizosphaerae]|uniref:Beta-ketoacyl-[acyl-carrier-protein] synthase family protein n=1 Tax=Flavobacterium rhizosphaerae TaxID=3163298 RepID=A0ABW8YWT8_9FLAO